jgi:hypothetical protein
MCIELTHAHFFKYVNFVTFLYLQVVLRDVIMCILLWLFISLERIHLSRHEVLLTASSECRCNRDERRCIPSPRETGTPCGEDGDYYFGMCNNGPGFCKEVESEFGNFGICVGIPVFGAPCNDYEVCTKNDKCKVVFTDDGLIRGVCVGTFDAELPCDDFDDRCTINDRCLLLTLSDCCDAKWLLS